MVMMVMMKMMVDSMVIVMINDGDHGYMVGILVIIVVVMVMKLVETYNCFKANIFDILQHGRMRGPLHTVSHHG